MQVMAVALPWGLRLLCIVNPPGSQSGSRDAIITGGVYPISLIMCLMIMQMSPLAEGPGMTLRDNGTTAPSRESLMNSIFCSKERVIGRWEFSQSSRPTYLRMFSQLWRRTRPGLLDASATMLPVQNTAHWKLSIWVIAVTVRKLVTGPEKARGASVVLSAN